MKDDEKKEKLSLKERLKDKRERAKLELIIYVAFFIFVIIFARVLGFLSSNVDDNLQNNGKLPSSFINDITDNYRYQIEVNVNDDISIYRGTMLGNNMTITKEHDNVISSYYVSKGKYYVLDEGNYLLTTKDNIYDMVEENYLNIKEIKEYLKYSIKEENVYKIKVSDIVLNTNSEEVVTLTIDEDERRILIDYTNLWKLKSDDITKVVVDITYYDINNIISLEE